MLDMLAWHVPYLGWTRLPAEVSEFEIAHFFSLRAEERSAVLTRYRDSLRLGAASLFVLGPQDRKGHPATDCGSERELCARSPRVHRARHAIRRPASNSTDAG